MVQIQIQGARRTQNYLIQLPKKTEKEVWIVSEEFARFVQKSAKLRAPRFTGELARSIKITSNEGNKEIQIVVEAPHGLKMEKGVGLPTWEKFPSYTSKTRGTYLIKTGAVGKTPGQGYKLVRRYKPFIHPATEAGLNRLPNMLKNAVRRSVK